MNANINLSRHSGAGRNPVKRKFPAKRDSWFCRYAIVLFGWIPACAGMTVC
ncbi:hypothetical protein GALL_163140 [mine drainage metagenome]|uniref:Uncharacterized protein n=1 Tax=mine drainage metagenome TaxID=410659 RepID=A0A1J5S0U6_9ZZZZ